MAVNNSITVQIVGNALLVDSRLIAERLEIRHETFMETIQEHHPVIEQAFEVIRFETGKPHPSLI